MTALAHVRRHPGLPLLRGARHALAARNFVCGQGLPHRTERTTVATLMKTRHLRVAEFAEIYSGGTPSTGNLDYWDGDVAWVTPKDLSARTGVYIGHGERFITEQGLSRSSARLLPADTVILSSRAPVGYVAIAKSPLATNQGCKNLRCKNGVAIRYMSTTCSRTARPFLNLMPQVRPIKSSPHHD